MERSILVAIDSSWYSSKILNYLCTLFVGQPQLAIHLITIIPCQTSEAGRDWLDPLELASTIDKPTRDKLQTGKLRMRDAQKKLLSNGFHDEQIFTEVRLSGAGVVAEIIRETHQGMYDALVIGKKDLSMLEKMVTGSISGEILRKNKGLPVWLVSGDIESHRFLVPVDCSPHSLDAVDHLSFILKDNPRAEITLFHSGSLLAAEEITPIENFYEKWGKEWCDKHLQGDEEGHFHFLATEQILREAGFPMEKVRRLDTKTGIEPGQQITYHVKKDDYGTIVMGRRAQDVSKGLFKGVSDRVLANVTDVSIWIVG